MWAEIQALDQEFIVHWLYAEKALVAAKQAGEDTALSLSNVYKVIRKGVDSVDMARRLVQARPQNTLTGQTTKFVNLTLSGADQLGLLTGQAKGFEIRDCKFYPQKINSQFACLDNCLFTVVSHAAYESIRLAIEGSGGVADGRLADIGAMRETFLQHHQQIVLLTSRYGDSAVNAELERVLGYYEECFSLRQAGCVTSPQPTESHLEDLLSVLLHYAAWKRKDKKTRWATKSGQSKGHDEIWDEDEDMDSRGSCSQRCNGGLGALQQSHTVIAFRLCAMFPLFHDAQVEEMRRWLLKIYSKEVILDQPGTLRENHMSFHCCQCR